MSKPQPVVLAALLWSIPAWAATAPTADKYWRDGWSWCDVHVLSRAWSVPDDEAARRMQYKLDNGLESALTGTLEAMRPQITPDGFSTCPYYEAGYTYDQMEALGRLWGTDVYEAKTRVESKLIWRNEAILQSELKAAPVVAMEGTTEPFYNAGLNYCDARMLADYWQSDTWEAKLRYSAKVEAGFGSTAARAMKTARKSFAGAKFCEWMDVPWDSRQAEVLASVWGTDVSEAKARMTAAAQAGKSKKVEAALWKYDPERQGE
jgi:hypothetical protein